MNWLSDTSTEHLPATDEDWYIEPEDDHTWRRVLLSLVALAVVGLLAVKLWYWVSPTPPQITVDISAPDISPRVALLAVGSGQDFRMESVLINAGDGGTDYLERVRQHKLPPRCRTVPAGVGCIDWLEPGETDWCLVLATRPVSPGRELVPYHQCVSSPSKITLDDLPGGWDVSTEMPGKVRAEGWKEQSNAR